VTWTACQADFAAECGGSLSQCVDLSTLVQR